MMWETKGLSPSLFVPKPFDGGGAEETKGLSPVGKSEVRRVDNLVREKGGNKIDAADF